MGGSCSQSLLTRSGEDESITPIAALMLPSYFVEDVFLSDLDLSLIHQSWKHIICGSGVEYLRVKAFSNFDFTSCTDWFSDVLHTRLFDVHPASDDVFQSGCSSHQVAVVNTLSLILRQLSEEGSATEVLHAIADKHSLVGVKAVEYGIFGDVLFYSLRVVLRDEYTAATDAAWKRLYSSFLCVLIPRCSANERRGQCPMYRRGGAISYATTSEYSEG